MNKYDSYKDSEIQWIEKIPTSWNTRKLKFLGTVYGGLTGKKGDDFGDEDNPKNKQYIPYTNIFNNILISKDHFDFVIFEKDEKQNLVKKNDLLVLMSSENYEDLGKTSILLDDCDELYLNSFCKGFRTTNENMNPIFINYQLQGHLHRELISVEGSGFTRINLQQNRLLNTPILTTSLTEQNQIVSYLDTKTLLIDSLIQRTQLKIELLKKKRNSTINEVVTNGLNPNIEMKESGVDWIGEVPRHWEIKKLKYLLKHIKEKLTPNENDKKISPEYVESDTGICTNFYSEYSGDGYKFIPGDILLNKLRIYLKKVLRVDFDGYSLGEMIVLRTEQKNLSEFIFNSFFSDVLIGYLNSLSTGVKVPRVSPDEILSTKFPLPPINEIIKINEFIKHSNSKIDKKVFLEEKKIDLLKEYKQSLISEVVSGKKKVVS